MPQTCDELHIVCGSWEVLLMWKEQESYKSFFLRPPLKHDTQLSPFHGIMALENGERGSEAKVPG